MAMRIERLTPSQLIEGCALIPGGAALVPHAGFMASEGIAFAFIADELCFGIGGIFPTGPGVGEMWALMDRATFRSPRFVRTSGLEILRQAFADLKLHRIQSNADMSLPYHARWLQSLGFQFEGVMKQFTPDRQDMARYALTQEIT